MWCIPQLDEEYIEKMEDVLATYEKPLSVQEPVVCLDEKPVTLHQEVRKPIPMQPGQVARRDYEYKRCGTANVFCAVEPRAGVHFTRATPNRTASQFADFLQSIADHYAEAETIHLVMDNLNTHTRKAVVERFGAQEGSALWARFTVHYTPKHASWLNQAEIEISMFARQCLGSRRMEDIEFLAQEAHAWTQRVNQDRVTIDWTFDRKKARKKLRYKFKRSRY